MAMREVTCLNDAVIFKSSRKDAKFCSPKCRQEYARNVGTKKAKSISSYNPPVNVSDRKKVKSKFGVARDIEHSAGGAVYTVGVDMALKGSDYSVEENLAAFQKMGLAKVNWITTGIPELDAFQKIPRGRVTQIQGPYAVGKTTLALNMIAGLKGHKVFYVDSEASLNPELLVKLRVEAKNFELYNDSAFIEDVYEKVVEAAESGKYDMIVVDSLASMTFKNEAEGDSTAHNIGQKAKVVNKLMRIIPMYLKKSDTALVVINQEREVIGSYVPMKYTPGGMGVPYAASLILALKTIPSWRFPKGAKNGAFQGHEIEVTIAKSKVSQPHRKAMVKLYYPEPQEFQGVDDEDAF